MKGIFSGRDVIEAWSLSLITTYYFLLIPAAGTLMTHPEHPILRDDIERGELAGRLLKPFSYFWQRFFIEIPVRIFQSISGVLIFFLLSLIFNNFAKIELSFQQAGLLVLIIMLAYMICFTFKMIIAIIGLWTTDNRGIRELVDVLIIVFAGYIVPVSLLPTFIEKVSYLTPFPYIIYFPIIAFLGMLSIPEMINVIFIQFVWLGIFVILFKYFWKKGLMRFTDLGH
jgi:ABC-2 type transport system permease protein